PGVTAFVNVNVIAMTSDRVDTHQTVIVRGGRIEQMGRAHEVTVPAGAAVIDGTDRYLVPGLTDAHVHLETGLPWAPARADFGDGRIYRAYGIRTVINLAGNETILDWRRRVEQGELIGPTIYTSGPFVNEPRVTSPDEVERDVIAQRERGYDVIKF